MIDSDPARDEALRLFLERTGLGGLDAHDADLALTHRSHAYEAALGEDNERLEFLGDSLIAALTSEYLYDTMKDASEGTLSKRRSHLVSRMLLGRCAEEMGLGDLLLLGRGERDTGGAHRRSTLGSALEALVGIVYLRLGFATARDFVRGHVLDALTQLVEEEPGHGDFKSLLQEWAQKHYKTVPVYTRLGTQGPDHDKQFTVQVSLKGRVLAQASGQRIKLAENEAARLALEAIREEESSQ